MTKTDIFQDMVLCGLACGLRTPQEWIRNYLMHETQMHAYKDIAMVEQLVRSVADDLYCAVHMVDKVDIKDLADWINTP